MIFEPLRRALVRLFGPRATSVSPQITENDIIERMLENGVVYVRKGESPLDALKQRVVGGAAMPVPHPGIKPPSDPAIDAGWTWAAWKRELDAGAMPGWAVCRFANRTGPDNAAFVFGIVRGSFGIWLQPFSVCAGADSTQPSIHRRSEHYVVCSCEDVDTAKIIATALNRQMMQMAQDQGNGDGY